MSLFIGREKLMNVLKESRKSKLTTPTEELLIDYISMLENDLDLFCWQNKRDSDELFDELWKMAYDKFCGKK